MCSTIHFSLYHSADSPPRICGNLNYLYMAPMLVSQSLYCACESLAFLRSASRSAYVLWLSLTLSTTSSLFWHELFFSVALLFYFMRSIVPHVLAWTFNICLPWLPSMTCGRCTSTVDTMCHHMCPQIHHCYHVTTLRLLMPRNYTTFIDAMATTDDT